MYTYLNTILFQQVDIQNTLTNLMLSRLGTEEQKQKYLPKLSTEMVSKVLDATSYLPHRMYR